MIIYHFIYITVLRPVEYYVPILCKGISFIYIYVLFTLFYCTILWCHGILACLNVSHIHAANIRYLRKLEAGVHTGRVNLLSSPL